MGKTRRMPDATDFRVELDFLLSWNRPPRDTPTKTHLPPYTFRLCAFGIPDQI